MSSSSSTHWRLSPEAPRPPETPSAKIGCLLTSAPLGQQRSPADGTEARSGARTHEKTRDGASDSTRTFARRSDRVPNGRPQGKPCISTWMRDASDGGDGEAIAAGRGRSHHPGGQRRQRPRTARPAGRPSEHDEPTFSDSASENTRTARLCRASLDVHRVDDRRRAQPKAAAGPSPRR